jgi:large subunit ribosomal protein L21
MTTTLLPETHDAIAARAFAIWQAEGQPHGRHEIHWQRATVEVTAANTNAPAAASDVSLIDGVGPKITAQLAAEGIVTLAQIAALSPKALEALDSKLNLKGRTAREDWISQAKELVAGATPRAKVDQVKLAKKK